VAAGDREAQQPQPPLGQYFNCPRQGEKLTGSGRTGWPDPPDGMCKSVARKDHLIGHLTKRHGLTVAQAAKEAQAHFARGPLRQRRAGQDEAGGGGGSGTGGGFGVFGFGDGVGVRRDVNGALLAPLPPQSADDPGCFHCGIDERAGLVLICDGCERDWHAHCLDPPLGESHSPLPRTAPHRTAPHRTAPHRAAPL